MSTKRLKSTGLFEYARPFSGHQRLKDEGTSYFQNVRQINIEKVLKNNVRYTYVFL